MQAHVRFLLATTASIVACGPLVRAQDASALEGPIALALERLGEDAQVFEQHIVTLANPFMEGRVPGSRGMEIAMEYMEFYLRQSGLEPPFKTHDGAPSYRQPFPLGEREVVVGKKMSLKGEALAERDFTALSVGGSGKASGEVVFVGYGIRLGADGYKTFSEPVDLEGKIALLLRFEPIDASGYSLWGRDGRWSGRIALTSKVRTMMEHNPAAVVVVNPPGAVDPRAVQLIADAGGGRKTADVPIVMISRNAAETFLENCQAPTLEKLRASADESGGTLALGASASIEVEIERRPAIAENVGGILRGRGDLADEWVVIGGHLDHLGQGEFGSRFGSGALHPGADDNASGSAGVMMIADKMAADYAALPGDAQARSVLFIGFSAEESGLHGSNYYVQNPLGSLADHALMINFDMIGRIRSKRLSVWGASGNPALAGLVEPLFAKSPLTVVQPERAVGGSDHIPFEQKGVPVLFAIIDKLHDDYHTPQDVSWKINREDAVHAIRLFHEIGKAAAFHPGPLRSRQAEADEPAPSRMEMKVRFGIRPDSYTEIDPGIPVGSVTPDTPAANAGVRAGDRLMKWNGKEIEDVGAWMGMLMAHEPGDVVTIVVERDGEMVTLKAKLTTN